LLLDDGALIKLGVALLVLIVMAPAGAQSSERWDPTAGMTFQLQLQGTIDTTVDAEVFDIDAFDVGAALVQELHDKGRKVVCYMSAGSWENWRPDARDFPRKVRGRQLEGWPGERWLDVRQLDVLGPLMGARLDRCVTKGFDAVDFDNMDVYTQDSGFDITRRQQIDYIELLANAAHERGLATGLKNLPQLTTRLEPMFDFAIVESCFVYKECGAFSVFIDHDKPVFEIEYELERSQFCDKAKDLGFTALRKRLSLKVWRRPCPL
jgi:hypothetical protein